MSKGRRDPSLRYRGVARNPTNSTSHRWFMRRLRDMTRLERLRAFVTFVRAWGRWYRNQKEGKG